MVELMDTVAGSASRLQTDVAPTLKCHASRLGVIPVISRRCYCGPRLHAAAPPVSCAESFGVVDFANAPSRQRQRPCQTHPAGCTRWVIEEGATL